MAIATVLSSGEREEQGEAPKDEGRKRARGSEQECGEGAKAPVRDPKMCGGSAAEARDAPSSTPASIHGEDDSRTTPCTVPRPGIAARTRLHFNERAGAAYTSYMSVHDILYGQMDFNEPLLKAVIDSQPFQRLRNLKQLGLASCVYPGAVHTRFEHSLGVAHRAAQLVQRLRVDQPGLNIDSSDILCVKLAGLCHDLGHGPFSHMYEKLVSRIAVKMPECDEKHLLAGWCHEDMSCRMLDLIFSQLREQGVVDPSASLSERDVIFVKELIKGRGNGEERAGRDHSKTFLYDIINNSDSGFDVDRLDYLERDQRHALGGGQGLQSFSRLTSIARVCKVVDSDSPGGYRRAICLPDKAAMDARRVFTTRALLHDQVYQHRVVVASDEAMCRVLELANDTVRIRGAAGPGRSIAGCALDPTAFANLTDGVVDVINNWVGGGEEMVEARRMIQLGRRACGNYVQTLQVGGVWAGSERGSKFWDVRDGGRLAAREIAMRCNNHSRTQEDGEGAGCGISDDDITVLRRHVHQGADDADSLSGIRFFSRRSNDDPALLDGQVEALPLRPGSAPGFEPARREFVVLCSQPPRSPKWSLVLRAAMRWAQDEHGLDITGVDEGMGQGALN